MLCTHMFFGHIRARLRLPLRPRRSFRAPRLHVFTASRPSGQDGRPERRYGAKNRSRGISPRMGFLGLSPAGKASTMNTYEILSLNSFGMRTYAMGDFL